MGVRIRDWIVALSLAAALGMLVGGVYSGVTGWQGPAGGMAGGSSTTRTTASAGSGLPTPNELPSPAAKPRPPAVRTAQVWTVDRPDTSGPAKAAKPAKDKPGEDRDRQGGNGDGDGGQAAGDRSAGDHAGQPKDEHGDAYRQDPAKVQQKG